MSTAEEEVEIPPAKRIKIDNDESEGASKSTTSDFMASSKYDDFVTPEELEKLKEFRVLDEVKSNDEDSNDEESDSSDGSMLFFNFTHVIYLYFVLFSYSILYHSSINYTTKLCDIFLHETYLNV